MEVFFHGLSPDLTEKRLRRYISDKFSQFGIDVCLTEKTRRKNCATTVILDSFNGERFLRYYTIGGGKLVLDKEFRCERSKHTPDAFKLRSLEKKVTDQARKIHRGDPKLPSEKHFPGSSISCGIWDYPDGHLTYVPLFMMVRPLTLYFGKRELVAIIDPMPGQDEDQLRIGVDYSSIQGMACASTWDASLVVTLFNSPKFYRLPQSRGNMPGPQSLPYGNSRLIDTDLVTRFSKLSTSEPAGRQPARVRITGLNLIHEKISGICNVLNLRLSPECISKIRQLLWKRTFLPDITNWPFRVAAGPDPGWISLYDFGIILQQSHQNLPFSIKFQLQRLVQGGFLHAHVVLKFIPRVVQLLEVWGEEGTVYSLQQMSKNVPYQGPETEAKFFSVQELEAMMPVYDASVDSMSAFSIVRRHSHLALIHRARVTPTGIYLEGPYAETKNNVLNKFSSWVATNFLRVSFEDENGQPLKYERFADLSEIHYKRFKRVLDNPIDIAGHKFRFLAFSHSSLREQSCWFCAPFIFEGSLVFGHWLTRTLGDFSNIRSPAKCAARIGQAFTDLNDNVELPQSAVRRVADIERNSRCFSDGCSTASKAVFHKLWQSYKPGRAKPTLFQIRYGGVKGMISLDKSLGGTVINVRPSQEKFPSDGEVLGVCGVAKRAMPLYLNRPLIKILEDLGIDKEVFLDFQRRAENELKVIAHSPVNAAKFLEIHDIGKSSGFAWLIRELYYLGVHILQDNFIWSALELTILMRLRDLKYRGRIPIAEGATLFGIMDETGFLRENEVYCSIGNGEILQGRVAVTRSPAMHPGDIQYVNAVNVPNESQLKYLENCIVFSQHGSRDIPSQLSGGDLDGDIFNVIHEPSLLPKMTYTPADYPRLPPIDIGRPVETSDITQFFIDFMVNDQLGRIANLHLQLTDQRLKGTLDPDCLKLANMHSTAVDFSKTGISVDIRNLPRASYDKPDFMAPGPRVMLYDGVAKIEEDPTQGLYQDEEDDVLEDLDPEGPKYRYYESRRALGHLYRAIDEQKFLEEAQHGKRTPQDPTNAVLHQVLRHVETKTQGIIWTHWHEWALEIKEQYENAMSDIMLANSIDPRKPLSEVEVFIGHVLGKEGAGSSKRARETARTVSERYEELVVYTSECVLKGEEEEYTEEALERSIACLAVAVETPPQATYVRIGKLVSFGYLAAGLCLRQVRRFSKDGF